MFLIILKYSKGIEIIDKYVEQHRDFLDKYYSQNKFICSGAQKPRNGGVIICNARDRDEIQQIIAEDPFFIHKAADYEIIEFNPSKCANGFEEFIQIK